MATRREVAEAAGVSVRTVSNVVNDFEHIATATRERVLAAMEQLDYRPSEMARSLKIGRTGLVALMLPELDTPYFAELTRAFVEEGAARGLTVVIDQTDGDPARERALLARGARGGLFDALVLSPLGLERADISVLRGDGPVVFLGEADLPGFDHVVVDNRAAAREAVELMIAKGRRRIGAIGWKSDGGGTVAQRTEGYREALTAAGLNVPAGGLPHTKNFNRSSGTAAMRELLAAPVLPDALFCFSDPLASAALRSLHDAGLRVPEDVAVVGFDDVDESRYSVPSLTSVSPDKRWIARTALDRVIRRLNGETLETETLIAPHELVVRESSGH